MISDRIRNAKFMLIFVGECPFAGIFDGWDALLDAIHEQYTVNDDEHAELIERMEDPNEWTFDTCRAGNLPFQYSEDTGEIGSMWVYRITEEPPDARGALAISFAGQRRKLFEPLGNIQNSNLLVLQCNGCSSQVKVIDEEYNSGKYDYEIVKAEA